MRDCGAGQAVGGRPVYGERSINRVIRLPARPVPVSGREMEDGAAPPRGAFDLAILFPNSFESAAVMFAAGIPRRVGYSRDGRGMLLTDPVPIPGADEIPRHERFYYLEMLRRAGLIARFDFALGSSLEGVLFDDTRRLGKRGLALFRDRGFSGPIVGVSPGAAYGTAKRWLPERFAAAARELGGGVVVFGSAAERGLCEDGPAVRRVQPGRSHHPSANSST